MNFIFNLKNSIIYFFNLIINTLKLFYLLLNNFFDWVLFKSLTTNYSNNKIESLVNPVRFSFSTNTRTFSTLGLTKDNLILDPYWVTGFTDAEGCFSVIIEMSSLLKWKVRVSYEINLHIKDIAILHSIKRFFGVGSIYSNSNKNSCVYRVTTVKDLIAVIIPHFTKYPLISKKRNDFLLWSEVITMTNLKEHLTLEGFLIILSKYAAMNFGVSPKITKHYPNIIASERPEFSLPDILEPQWVSGFIAGDGGFSIIIRPKKSNNVIPTNIEKPNFEDGYRIEFRMHVTQHKQDEKLINKLVNYFGCGKVYFRNNITTPRCDFIIQNLSDIYDKVLPHFDKYPLNNLKQLDYLDFKEAILIMKSEGYLTKTGFNEIKLLKENMNNSRSWKSLPIKEEGCPAGGAARAPGRPGSFFF